MGTALTYETIEDIAMHGRPYPVDELEGCETGLVLFAAAFYGHNDAVHFAEARIKTTCVDIDGSRLAKMSMLYPKSWQWVEDDAWNFADHAYMLGQQWDAVSVDTFTGEAMDRSLKSIDLWCSLARKLVTVTYTVSAPIYNYPEGWKSELYERATGVYWLVLTRA